MNPLLLLTRQEPVDDSLAASASSLGFTVERVHLLETQPGPDARAILERLARGRDGTGIAWTSRRGAEALAGVLQPDRGELEGIPLYAVGAESAAPMSRLGYHPVIPDQEDGARGLAALILRRAARDGVRSVLYLRGDRSLEELPKALQAGGLEVVPLTVYRTHFMRADLEGPARALRGGAPVVIAFFSPTGILALERILDSETLEIARDRAVAIARGPTTAKALDEHGYRNVFRIPLEALRAAMEVPS